jgi:hypothetical protein
MSARATGRARLGFRAGAAGATGPAVITAFSLLAIGKPSSSPGTATYVMRNLITTPSNQG